MRGNVYVSAYGHLCRFYLNRNSCDVLGVPAVRRWDESVMGTIQGPLPCPFCTNQGEIDSDGFYEWEFANRYWNEPLMIKNQVINWEGRRARMELSHDMYSEDTS